MKIEKGQIWRDWDIRFRNQIPVYKRILRVTKTHAYVEGFREDEKIISKSKIRLDRFKPNSTGYKYIGDSYEKE